MALYVTCVLSNGDSRNHSRTCFTPDRYVDFRTEDERRVHGQEVDAVDARASGEAEDPAIALAAGRTRRSSVARRHNIRQRRGSVSSVRSSASARSRLSMHDFIVQAVAGETSGGMKMLLQDPDKHDPYVGGAAGAAVASCPSHPPSAVLATGTR